MRNENFAYGNSLELGNNQPPIALAGFFSWLKRAVTNVVTAVAKVSHNPIFIVDILENEKQTNKH